MTKLTFKDIAIGSHFIDESGELCLKTSDETAVSRWCAVGFEEVFAFNVPVIPHTVTTTWCADHA